MQITDGFLRAKINEAEFKFCLNFVIEVSMKTQLAVQDVIYGDECDNSQVIMEQYGSI